MDGEGTPCVTPRIRFNKTHDSIDDRILYYNSVNKQIKLTSHISVK